MYFGGAKVVEKTNNTLVVTLLGTFALLISSVVPNLDLGNFAHIDVPEALKAVPVMILALVYHNIVPVVCSQMDGEHVHQHFVGGVRRMLTSCCDLTFFSHR